MRFWNEEKIRFYRRAEEQLGFHRELARRAAACLPEGARVCDAGCGLGYLALELAELGARVTAVDVDPAALAVLRELLQTSEHSDGIELLERDVFALEPERRFDAMVFCFFGEVEDALRCARRHCGGKVILFKKDWEQSRFQLGKRKLQGANLQRTVHTLENLAIPCRVDTFPLDMGQPLASLEEAVAFFRLYDRLGEEIRPEAVAQRLEPGDCPEYPLYLPAKKQVGMIVLDAADIPADL